MNKKIIKIGTRSSKLALIQANEVKQEIIDKFPNQYNNDNVKIIPIMTKGDLIQDRKLLEIGGKGLFTEEIEKLLFSNEIDLAVHSMKDVNREIHDDLEIASMLKRKNPYDAFVSEKYNNITELPQNSVIGTSSVRREVQLQKLRPDLIFKTLRGNLITRINKLKNNECDATIMAIAGLERLDMSHYIKEDLSKIMIPAIGQGAIAIEVNRNNTYIKEIVKKINDIETMFTVNIERDFLKYMNGSCSVPIGAHCSIIADNKVKITGFYAHDTKSKAYTKTIIVDKKDSIDLGKRLYNEIIS